MIRDTSPVLLLLLYILHQEIQLNSMCNAEYHLSASLRAIVMSIRDYIQLIKSIFTSSSDNKGNKKRWVQDNT